MSQARPIVFIKDDRIFSSVNSSRLPSVPNANLLWEDRPLPHHFKQPCWADNRFPALAFVPVKPRFDKPPVHILRSTHGGGFCVKTSDSGWKVDPKLVQEWSRLERNLRLVARVLQKQLGTSVELPSDMRHFPSPEKYGLMECHLTEEAAQEAARVSRDAFLPLMAWCSFIISFYHWQLDPPSPGTLLSSPGKWERELWNAGLPSDVIRDLKESEIADFSPDYQRAGVFVGHICKFKHLLCHIQHCAPMWIYWGHRSTQYRNMGSLNHLRPTPDELSALDCIQTVPPQQSNDPSNIKYLPIAPSSSCNITSAANPRDHPPLTSSYVKVPSHSSGTDVSSPPLAPSVSIVNHFPVPEFISGQIHGETWKEYFERMGEHIRDSLQKETPLQTQKRLSMERAHARQSVPGSKGPSVWHWEEDVETGFRMRRRVDHKAVDEFWRLYATTQRRYNSFTNEWDVCTEFDVEAEVDDLDEGGTPQHAPVNSSSVDASPVYLSNIVANQSTGLATAIPITVPHADVARPSSPKRVDAQFTTPSSEADAHQPPIEAVVQASLSAWKNIRAETYDDNVGASALHDTSELPDLLFQRYGFLCPSSDYDVTFDSPTCWTDVRKILGDVDSHVDHRLQIPITHFLHAQLSENIAILHELCDLAPNSLSPLVSHANPRFQVTTLSLVDRAYYFIGERENGNDNQWELMLEDAATVLECFRRDDASILAIAKFLITTGRAFSTRVIQSKLSPSVEHCVKPTIIPSWLHYRSQPQPSDYAYYEELRTKFMARPHARAAFLAGGIIWRLALESAGSASSYRALDGPSDEVMQFGNSLQRPHDNKIIWDDSLTEAEMDLMCGVYKVYTGKHANSTQGSYLLNFLLSRHPKPDIRFILVAQAVHIYSIRLICWLLVAYLRGLVSTSFPSHRGWHRSGEDSFSMEKCIKDV